VRRRLIVTIVLSVVTALVLAGLGTLALSRLGARRYTEDELQRQVEVLADSLSEADGVFDLRDRPRLLGALRSALSLEGAGLVALPPVGPIEGVLPEGITLTDDDLAALRAGESVTGHERRLVYAAAVIQRGENRTVIVVSDRTDIALGGTVVWFGLAALIVAAVGAIVATRLARTLTEPLRAAEDASRRIAAGDLAARVPDPPPGAHDEVADLSRSVNAMAETLERARGLEQQFLLSVSHDLRTPLTSIQGYAEALADGTAPDPVRAGEVILGESARLTRLVRDLLELARLDSRTFTFDPVPVELDDLVEACAEGFAPEAAASGVRITVDAAAVVVRADADRLAQVVANLLENALKHTTSSVQVSVATDGFRARVSVDDDGPGIAAADLPHVFERLYVARHQPVRAEAGSGLGLAIVRELVVAMGGHVGAESSPAGGARLWVDLPVSGGLGPNPTG
jgi:two-component system, OmpR family, sensor kinase